MDGELREKEPTIADILAYLGVYNRQWYDSSMKETSEYEEVVSVLLDALKRMPDCFYRLKGSYTLYGYERREAELFYISDMGILRSLLRDKQYGAFIHEVYDFLNFKIMQEDLEKGPAYLPKNIKEALIYTIECKTET